MRRCPAGWWKEAVSPGRRTASLETPRFMVRDTNHPRKTFLNDTMHSFILLSTWDVDTHRSFLPYHLPPCASPAQGPVQHIIPVLAYKALLCMAPICFPTCPLLSYLNLDTRPLWPPLSPARSTYPWLSDFVDFCRCDEYEICPQGFDLHIPHCYCRWACFCRLIGFLDYSLLSIIHLDKNIYKQPYWDTVHILHNSPI